MHDQDSSRLPTALWVSAHLQQLNIEGVPYYILNKGAHAAGTVLLKINGLEEGCLLLIQQRDLMSGAMGWMHALTEGDVTESAADEYIQRALNRDPDLWVIEIEDREKKNPFEGKIL